MGHLLTRKAAENEDDESERKEHPVSCSTRESEYLSKTTKTGLSKPVEETLSARYGLDFVKKDQVERVRRLENEFGTERVSRWVREGMTVETMGKPRDMKAFRKRQEKRSAEIPRDVERRNEMSLQRSIRSAREDGPAGETRTPDVVRSVISSSGHSLDDSVQREMEDRMDDDFDDVRIHTGPQAAAAADAINARAFTVGNHVVFNEGEYQPDSADGKRVLAHELTHVRQQTEDTVSMLPKADAEGAIEPTLEQEAKESAHQVTEDAKTGGQPETAGSLAENRAPRDGPSDTGPAHVDTVSSPTPSGVAVQMRNGTSVIPEMHVHRIARRGVAGEGDSLPYQSKLERHVDSVDLSDIRAHTDNTARRANETLGSDAYAIGTDIAFRRTPDQETVAHEVAHVVQQRHGELPDDGVGRPGDTYERAADRFASAVNRGQSATPLPSQNAETAAVATSVTSAVQFQNGPDDEELTTGFTYSEEVSDGPYGWTAAYDVELTGSECLVTVGVNLVPDDAVTDEQYEEVKEETKREFARYFDGRFELRDQQDNTLPLRVEVDFEHTAPHVDVALHPGHGRANLTNWFVEDEPITRAHELGHQLGLKDEYVDANVQSRDSPDAPDVFQDHSLMGNYFAEGEGAADVRQRHGESLAEDISGASGRQFDVAMSDTYTVRQGDTLAGIALRIYGDESRWVDIFRENEDQIDDPDHIEPGWTLQLP